MDITEKTELGKRINIARKEQGLTAEKLSEMCSINSTYLRQIEGGSKIPSLPVFIDICNKLGVSSDYLLQDSLSGSKAVTKDQMAELWDRSTPNQMRLIFSMIQVALKCIQDSKPED